MLGLGLMGAKMAVRMAECGLSVTGWSRSPERAADLVARAAAARGGAAAAAPDVARLSDPSRSPPDPAAACAGADCVVLMLSDAAAIRATAELGRGAGGAGWLDGKTVLQMGTIGPDDSRALSAELTGGALGRAARYVEAPVLGSQPEAAAGTLILMAGTDDPALWAASGDPAAAGGGNLAPAGPAGPDAGLAAASAALAALGARLNPAASRRLGPVGAGAAAKLAFNHLIAALTVAFASSLALLEREGVDVSSGGPFLALLRASALYAPTFDKKLQRMLDRDYAGPNFPTKHLAKDAGLFAAAARARGVGCGAAEGAGAVARAAAARGMGDTDYSAVAEEIRDPGGSGVPEGVRI